MLGTAMWPESSEPLPQPGVSPRELLAEADALSIALARRVTDKKTLATVPRYVTDVPTAGSGIVDDNIEGFDPTRPNAARVYDYFLGGKNHFAADRETAKTVLAAAPTTLIGARENRAFLGRAVRYLVAEAGIRQFLDIGTGLPTANNVHEVPQAAQDGPVCGGGAVCGGLAWRCGGVAGWPGGEGAPALRPAAQPGRVAEQSGQRHGRGDGGGPGPYLRARDVATPGREVA
jgi:hypothetical protein